MLASEADLKEMVENQFDFLRNMGLKIISCQPNKVKLMLPKAGNVNHIGTIWAGALFTLAEVPGGVLALTTFDGTRFYPLVKEMNIKFIKPATTDVTIEIALEKTVSDELAQTAEKEGKADFTLHGEVIDEKENVVAVTDGFYQLRTV